MQLFNLVRRLIPASREGRYVAVLKISTLVGALVLATLTYNSIVMYPSYRSKLLTLVSSLQQPHYLPALVPCLLIPFVPLLRGRIRWIFIACLISGVYLNSFQRQNLKMFHANHRIKFNPSAEIRHQLRSEESLFLKQCVAPFLDLRNHLRGATLILPEDTPSELDSFRLFSIALVDKVERVPLQSEITRQDLDTFASRPGVKSFQYSGSNDKDKRYIFMPPTPSKVYRVYTSDKNLVFAEEGYVFKQPD